MKNYIMLLFVILFLAITATKCHNAVEKSSHQPYVEIKVHMLSITPAPRREVMPPTRYEYSIREWSRDVDQYAKLRNKLITQGECLV